MASKERVSDGRKKAGLDIWTIISLCLITFYGFFMIYPLIKLIGKSLFIDGKFSLDYFKIFFSDKYYYSTIWSSLKISIATTLVSLVIGIPMAYFYEMYNFPGRKYFQMVIMLCSMSAPTVSSFALILMLGRNGFVRKLLTAILGFEFPTIYGVGGIIYVLSLGAFPTVFLYLSGALKNMDNSLLEASENMGCAGWKRFFKVVIPLCIPTILASSLLVFMRAFSDFSTPLLIGEGYRTFPVLIYQSYFSEVGGNTGLGAAVSVIAVIITLGVFLLQNWANNKNKFTMNAMHSIVRKPIKGIKSLLVSLYCWIPVLLAFAPNAYVIYQSFQNTSGKIYVDGYSLKSYKEALKKVPTAIPNTFKIGLLSLAGVVIISILIAYVVVRRRNVFTKAIDIMSMIPYILPGSVIGVSLVYGFASKPFVLIGTVTIMVVAFIVRRTPNTVRSSVATLQQIPLSIEEAALSLGASKLKTFFGITVPMMASGILSGAILSFISIMTEISSSIMLYTTKTITLTLAVYIYVSRGSDGIASAYASILSYCTIACYILYLIVSKKKGYDID